MATIIGVDNTRTPIEPTNGTDFSLDELRSVVGGWIEIVYHGNLLPSNFVLVVNGDGWVMNPPLPLNPIATVIAGQPIAGNVLLCERKLVR